MGKTLRINTIEKLGLSDRVSKMYGEGRSAAYISKTFQGEGYDVDVMQVRNHINSRIKPHLEKKRAASRERESVLSSNEANPELKLLEAITESYENYTSLKDDPDPKRQKEASEWFAHYKDLLEKHLRASGTYERAKNDAREDDDKLIEVVWIIRHVCESCGKTEDEILVHNVTNMSDKQTEIERQKDAIEESMVDEK